MFRADFQHVVELFPALTPFPGIHLPIYSQGFVLGAGPEWGYRSTLELALAWDQMTSGLWRKWDAGAARDLYVSTWTYRGTTAAIDSIISTLDLAKGVARFLRVDSGLYPFGPLVDCTPGSEKRVRVGPPVLGPQIIGSDLWTISLDIYLLDAPAAGANLGSLTPFLARASFSPSVQSGWGISAHESGFGVSDVAHNAYQTVASAVMSTADARASLQRLVYLRGEPFAVAGATRPFGPGVPYSSGYGSSYGCRAKAFSWQHLQADTWSVSVTLVRDP